MERQTLRQLRGATDLVVGAVEGATNAVAGTQMAIAGKPYAILAQVRPIARPVRRIEQVQSTITVGVYHALQTTTQAVRTFSALVLDRLDERSHP